MSYLNRHKASNRLKASGVRLKIRIKDEVNKLNTFKKLQPSAYGLQPTYAH
jgi:hypothetical protein